MKPRAAALAFAAPLLLTAPAFGDNDKSRRSGATFSIDTGSGSFSYSTDSNRYSYHSYNSRNSRGYSHNNGRYRLNRWGQSSSEVKRLERNAAKACYSAIRSEASRYGFRDVDFDDGKRVTQTGAQSFSVRFNEVEFESRWRDYETRVTCNIRYGRVAEIHGIPQTNSRRNSNRGRNYYGY